MLHMPMVTVLSIAETAMALGLSKTAASNRYIRALKRLKDALAELGCLP